MRLSTARTGTRPSAEHVIGSDDGNRRSGDLAELAARNADAARQLTDGQPHHAVTALTSLLHDCRATLGAEHPETLVVEGNLAAAYVMAGQERDGTPLMLANLARRERVFGDEHPATLTARDALATTHRLAGRLSEALSLYSRTAPQRNRVLGPSHLDTLTTRLGLGLTFADAGDPDMALDVITAAVQDCDRADAGNHHAQLLRSCQTDLLRATSPDGTTEGAAEDTGEENADDTAHGSAAVPRQRSSGTAAGPAARVAALEGRRPIVTGSGAEPGGGP